MANFSFKKLWVYLLISALLFAVSCPVLYYDDRSDSPQKPDISYISSGIQRLETELNEMTDSLVSDIHLSGTKFFFSQKSYRWCDDLSEKNYAIYISKEGDQYFWTDNSFLKPIEFKDSSGEYKVQYINNSWVLLKQKKYNDFQVSSMIILKRDYFINNQYFESSFNPSLKINSEFAISNIPDPAGYTITDIKGDFLFCLIPVDDINERKSGEVIFFLIFFAAFLVLLFFFYRCFKLCSFIQKRFLLFLLTVFFIIFRLIQTYYLFPGFLYDSFLFSPVFYASSKVLPSVGDLLLNIILFFFLALLFNKKSFYLKTTNPYLIYLTFFIFILFAEVISWILNSIIFHSGINVNLFNIIESDSYVFVILLIYLLLIGSLLLIIDKLTRIRAGNYFQGYRFPVSLLIIYFFVNLIIYFINDSLTDIIFIIFIAIIILFYHVIYNYENKQKYTNLLIVMFISALFISFHFCYYYHQKNVQVQKTLSMGLSNEHDVVSEMQMEDLSNRIKKDFIIKELSQKPYENQENIFSYVKRNYIYGYWTKYELQTTLCSPYDNLRIQQTGKLYPCYQYFEEMVKNNGVQIESSNFYYIDLGNGRINYLGVFDYYKEGDSLANRMYIELNSRLQIHVLGYPDILIDKKIKRSKNLDDYSYAVYRKGKLVSASGKYQYSLSARMYNSSKSEFYYVTTDDYENLVYRPDEETIIVLTSRNISFYNYLTLFAYIFTLLSLIFVLYYIYTLIRNRTIITFFTVKQRIRTSLITVFLISLVMLGSVTIYYITNKYREKQKEVLTEKMQSILVELSHKLGSYSVLKESDKESVTNMLIKFSNVFFTDIHLYDLDGVLYSTSRNDVFNKGLMGNMMNPVAYNVMSYQQKTQYVHQEKIGNLLYYSGYVPFINQQGQLMAYLNLPYFTKQTDLTREISDFIVALINILLILFILGIWLTWWLSDNLTRPLAMIQKKMQNVRLGKPNEPIKYGRMDEIGALVTEYNRMLNELEESARMLAESERELAWREMAKQIAHEIKNPLTPMKISIQYLQKAFHENKPGWESMIDKVTKTLIEQIDSLSAIASEFSAFARMPYPTKERVNMEDMGKSLVALYEHIDNIEFSLTMNNEEELWVTGDKEHLLRMFNNLIKNSIQAIPSDQKGIISIEMTGYPQQIMIKVNDNGTGISPDMQDRMFTPNFTTKSSGMGLGLAIVKRIVETMNGSIRFVTAENEGTTFFIQLPKL